MTAGEALRCVFDESGCLGVQPQMGGKFHLKLNIGTRPIANKYCEGKMKSTLKRELKVCETVEREAIEVRCERIRISCGSLAIRGALVLRSCQHQFVLPVGGLEGSLRVLQPCLCAAVWIEDAV